MADPLEAAAEALTARAIAKGPHDGWRRETTQAIVTAYLDSLLGELPEEAVARLESAYLDCSNAFDAREDFREAARAFIRSLRDSLVSGREGQRHGE